LARGPQVVVVEIVVSPTRWGGMGQAQSPKGGFGKLVLYCFRGGGAGWVEPRAQRCPKAVAEGQKVV
jgi:hypothetical protein